MENTPEFYKKPEPESEEERVDREVREKIKDMVEKSFVPKHAPRSQEERQTAWDEAKRKQSEKLGSQNLE